MTDAAWAELLHRDAGPLYRQAAQRLRAAIESGALPLGCALPTEAELAERFGVSLITIRAALRDLEQGGLIRKRAAKTAVVASALPRRPAGRSSALDVLATALAGARLHIESLRPARSAEAARLLGLAPRSPMPCLRGLLRRGPGPGEILSAIAIYWPSLAANGVNRVGLEAADPRALFTRPLAVPAASASLRIAAAAADAPLAARLACAPGAPLLTTRIAFLDGAGQPVQLVLAQHRAASVALDLGFDLPGE